MADVAGLPTAPAPVVAAGGTVGVLVPAADPTTTLPLLIFSPEMSVVYDRVPGIYPVRSVPSLGSEPTTSVIGDVPDAIALTEIVAMTPVPVGPWLSA